MRLHVLSLAVALVSLSMPASVIAAPVCPPEVKEARGLLTAKTATARKQPAVPRAQASARAQDLQAPRGQDLQAPRQQEIQAPRGQDLQAPRQQEIQAPRGQDLQAPRQQEIQAPRGQDLQAPRQQEIQAPRGQDIQAPRNAAKGRTTALANARRLVNEAEAACKDADNARAASNARAALELLKYLP
jgi:hypothetical protein